MLTHYVQASKEGKPVFVPDVRDALADEAAHRIDCVLVLPDGSSTKLFRIPVPELTALSADELDLVYEYVRAEIYNRLATLGGYSLALYFHREQETLAELVSKVIAEFQLDRSRRERTAYARIVNMLDRMNDALHPEQEPAVRRFTITTHDISELPAAIESVTFRAEASDAFRASSRNLRGTLICGLDVGGTDIKAALAADGELVALKEYDWNPAGYADVEMIVEPIVTIARLMRARAALAAADAAAHENNTETSEKNAVQALLQAVMRALRSDAPLEEMASAAALAEKTLKDRMRAFDAIGLCFPDVVVRDRIVGGEVPKTQGMRRNARRDFEEQFVKLTDLNVRLEQLCRDGGVVANTNDGPMAAFTAAVEIASSPTPEVGRNGVFAHSLGTDLGTGLALADGTIPEIPLEVYNLVLDLGSEQARRLPPEDLRSLANTNTGIPGTPQKLASQASAFRLADELLRERREELIRRIEEEGFVVDEGEQSDPEARRIVPESPVDRRKSYLAYLMELASHDEDVAEVFRTIGENMAVVYRETEHILSTGLRQRFLFGRFVKVARVFDLMQEGAARREPELEFVAADSNMAYTPLMRALDADPEYTVAQFGQAVGAVYFANLSLQESLQ